MRGAYNRSRLTPNFNRGKQVHEVLTPVGVAATRAFDERILDGWAIRPVNMRTPACGGGALFLLNLVIEQRKFSTAASISFSGHLAPQKNNMHHRSWCKKYYRIPKKSKGNEVYKNNFTMRIKSRKYSVNKKTAHLWAVSRIQRSSAAAIPVEELATSSHGAVGQTDTLVQRVGLGPAEADGVWRTRRGIGGIGNLRVGCHQKSP